MKEKYFSYRYLILIVTILTCLFLFSAPSLALIPGDFGSAGGGPPDGVVDFEDLMIFALAYGSTHSDANWNVLCDIASEGGILQPDGVIDFEDLMIFAMHYGEVAPSPDWLGTPQLDPDTIFTKEATDVHITILVNCNPEELSSESPVNVFLQNDNAEWILLGEMFDDGDLNNHGDEIKGDRIYSNIFSFYEENEKTIPLKIVVISSVNETYIVYFKLEVIASVGEESIQEVKNIHGLAEQKLNDIVEGPGIDTEEILDVLGGYLNEQTGIESTVTDGNLLQINYESGIISFILLEDISTEPTLGSMVRESTPSIPLSQQTTGTNVLEVESGLYDSSFQITKELDDVVYTGSRSVFIWVPFAAQIKSWGYNVVSDFVTRFENSTLGFSITTVEDEEADVDSLKNITDYGMVIFTTHGAKGNWLATGEVVPWYLSNPIYGLWLKLKHMAIWQNMKVKAEGGVLVLAPVYAVSSGWFNSNLSGNFSNTIILNMSCESAKTNALWNAFKGKGAGAYFGFDAIVSVGFATDQGYDLVEKLREGDSTTGEAYEKKTDPYITPSATWLIWGKENLKFPKGLINGSFEDGLKGWKTDGDGRVLYALAAIKPIHGEKMGIISTGLGYTTKYGSIQQTFQVGEDYQILRFYWNYLSEEFLEWIGSQYQDPFKVTFIKIDDSSITILLSKTVDSIAAEFGASYSNGGDLIYVSPGIVFDQGDVWMTGWQEFEYDISAFQGSVVTIKFEAVDEGDEIYDTAILLDNIRLEQ